VKDIEQSTEWKSGDGGAEVPSSHPAGEIRLPFLASVGARSAALAGVLMGVGISAAIMIQPLMTEPSVPTIGQR
jgi:hypothetical protein